MDAEAEEDSRTVMGASTQLNEVSAVVEVMVIYPTILVVVFGS